MTTPLHVCLISPGWPLGFPNGIATYVHHMRAGLLAAGHRVTVLAFSVGNGHDDEGVYRITEGPLRRMQRPLLRRFGRLGVDDWVATLIADAVKRVHRSKPIDLIEMEESAGWFARAQALLDVPVVPRLHGPAFLTQRYDSERATEALKHREGKERSALMSVRAVSAPSAFTLNTTAAECGSEKWHGALIPQPITSVVDAGLIWNAKTAARKRLLYVGRFEALKGADTLLRALRLALDRDPALELDFVGPDQGHIAVDGRQMSIQDCIEAWYRPEQRAAVRVRGRLDSDRILRMRCEAQVTIIASRFENLPFAALEAQSQGCPVIATAVGGIPEIIEHGRTGWLVPAGDVDAMSDAILRLTEDVSLASSLGGQGLAHSRAKHDPVVVAHQAVAFYRDALTWSRHSNLLPKP